MTKEGIVAVASIGDDCIRAYCSKSYREMFKIQLRPIGTKSRGIDHFAKGPLVGPGFLYYRKAEGQLLVANTYDDSLSIIDLPSQSVTNTILAGSRPNCIEIPDHNNRVFVTNYDSNSVSVIDLNTGQLTEQIPCGVMPKAILFNENNNLIYIANTGNNCISIIDPWFVNKTRHLHVDGNPMDICIERDGQKLYVIVLSHENRGYNCLIEYDIETGERSRCLRLGTMPMDLLYDNEAERLYVLDAMDNTVITVDRASFTVLGAIELGKMPISQSLESGGKHLHIVCIMDSGLYKVDLHAGSVINSLSIGAEPAYVITLC